MTDKKTKRKHVKILNSELEKKRFFDPRFPKWKLKICSILKIEPARQHQYLFRVHYKGGAKLKAKDVVCNKQGVMFAVVQDNNRTARIVTIDGYIQKPTMHGNLIIIEEPSTKKENNPKAIK